MHDKSPCFPFFQYLKFKKKSRKNLDCFHMPHHIHHQNYHHSYHESHHYYHHCPLQISKFVLDLGLDQCLALLNHLNNEDINATLNASLVCQKTKPMKYQHRNNKNTIHNKSGILLDQMLLSLLVILTWWLGWLDIFRRLIPERSENGDRKMHYKTYCVGIREPRLKD